LKAFFKAIVEGVGRVEQGACFDSHACSMQQAGIGRARIVRPYVLQETRPEIFKHTREIGGGILDGQVAKVNHATQASLVVIKEDVVSWIEISVHDDSFLLQGEKLFQTSCRIGAGLNRKQGSHVRPETLVSLLPPAAPSHSQTHGARSVQRKSVQRRQEFADLPGDHASRLVVEGLEQ